MWKSRKGMGGRRRRRAKPYPLEEKDAFGPNVNIYKRKKEVKNKRRGQVQKKLVNEKNIST